MPRKFRSRFSKRSTRRRFLQGSATAVSGLALSSCGWTLAQVSDTPPEENKDVLYIYTWAGYTDDELLERFREQTGIRAIADVFDSNEAMLARIQASNGGGYSIIYPSDYMVQEMVDLDLLTRLDKSRIEGWNRLYPRFLDPIYDPDDQYSVPVSWGTTGLIYNRTKLKSEPEDWIYLWNNQQQLSRRMSLLNDVREVIGAALKLLGYSYNSTNPQEIKQAYEKLAELKPALAAFTSDAWRTQILSGDLFLAMCYSSDATEIMPENENLDYVLPTSGSSVWADTLVMPRTAPNPDGAYAWINFMLQPEIAAQICERLSFATPNKQAFKLLPTEIQNNQSLFPSELALERCEGIAPIGEEVSEIYDLYWTKLTSA